MIDLKEAQHRVWCLSTDLRAGYKESANWVKPSWDAMIEYIDSIEEFLNMSTDDIQSNN